MADQAGVEGFRLTFDLHRAVSLWFSVLLLPFAWSSVWQNLTTQVYQPVMQAVGFRFTDPDAGTPPSRGVLPSPPVGFREAMAAGEVASRADAAAHGYRYISPFRLTYDIASGRYAFQSHVSLDPGEYGGLSVLIDGRDGRALQVIRSDLTRGDVVTNLLGSIHTADIAGSLLYRWIVASVGVACALLSVTGVVVWLRKRNARLSRRKAMQP